MTKDERFLLELYHAILAQGGPDQTASPHQAAEKLGFKERLEANILRGLMQANFVRRYGPDEVGLTELGIKLARSLLE